MCCRPGSCHLAFEEAPIHPRRSRPRASAPSHLHEHTQTQRCIQRTGGLKWLRRKHKRLGVKGCGKRWSGKVSRDHMTGAPCHQGSSLLPNAIPPSLGCVRLLSSSSRMAARAPAITCIYPLDIYIGTSNTVFPENTLTSSPQTSSSLLFSSSPISLEETEKEV